jgi:LPPG:FO 2-phospho-L-lactate transferase
MTEAGGHVIALCGGVGGAKLAFGLSRILPADGLSIVVNTGDDFEHLGLNIAPDIDTVVYTLADLADRERGWGVKGESWNFMAALRELGGEDWFNLGDRDLATHIERRRRLAAGETLSQITASLAAIRGLTHPIVPMSDDPVRTMIDTDQGPLAFQHYFVRERCAPVARAIRFEGAERAAPSPAFQALLARRDIAAVIICPSNPYLSVDPILSVPGVREALAAIDAPTVAVSPIVGGAALKGPAAKLMREFGIEPDNAGIAAHYRGLIDGLVIDGSDADEAGALGVPSLATQAIMHDDADRIRLARETIDFARLLGRTGR